MNKHSPTEQALIDYIRYFRLGTAFDLPQLYPRLLFDERARETFMLSVGFIVSIYYQGNIRLAETLAKSLHRCLHFLAPQDGAIAEVFSDGSDMSFAFQLYGLLENQDDYERILRECEAAGKHPSVKKLGRHSWDQKAYGKIYNGGIIFHGMRRLHCLENEGEHPWSTHT